MPGRVLGRVAAGRVGLVVEQHARRIPAGGRDEPQLEADGERRAGRHRSVDLRRVGGQRATGGGIVRRRDPEGDGPTGRHPDHRDARRVDAVGRRLRPEPAHGLHAVVDGVVGGLEVPGQVVQRRARVEAVAERHGDEAAHRVGAGDRCHARLVAHCEAAAVDHDHQGAFGRPAVGRQVQVELERHLGAGVVLGGAVLRVEDRRQLRVGVLRGGVEAGLRDGATRGCGDGDEDRRQDESDGTDAVHGAPRAADPTRLRIGSHGTAAPPGAASSPPALDHSPTP